MTRTDIEAQIADAKVRVAKAAIGSPEMYVEWDRLVTAKRKLRSAETELDAAQRAWNELIAPAPSEWKALAPIPE